MAYEDFTTYTEVDPNNRITVTPTKATVVEFPRNETAYLLDDKGVAHFNGNHTHLIEIYGGRPHNNSAYAPYCLQNIVGDFADAYAGDCIALQLRHPSAEAVRFYLYVFEGGVAVNEDSTPNKADETLYYVTIDRDYNGGVNSKGRMTATIRTGSHTGALIDTLIADCTVQTNFRYISPCSSQDINNITKMEAYSQNLDLQESAPLIRTFSPWGRMTSSTISNNFE